ncbi:MAG: HD domain-containing protein [Desulfomonilaceae bacterium]
MNFNFKRVADPIYKTIGLSELEVRVVNTSVFQRLRSIKQLGLAHFVFPGADYSRFSHSLGVCHVSGRILEALRNSNASDLLKDKDIVLYRLAGLLHDIGHYPFSHAMENAVKKFYLEKLVDEDPVAPSENDQQEDDTDKTKFFGHEETGEMVLANDRELLKVFKDANIDPDDVSSIFMRSKPRSPANLENLISSDLDADRIDYLLRTAHHSGLPYGSVDLDYIISQMRVDKDRKVCLTMKALRAADHMLLCRYFDYLQSTYHKTVRGIELVLEDVIMALLDAGLISCSRYDVTGMIRDGTWERFDESCLIEKIRLLAENSSDQVITTKTESILKRLPPKLVWEDEFLASRNEARIKEFSSHLVQAARKNKPQWADQCGIEQGRWYIWSKNVALTSVGSLVEVSSSFESKTDEEDNYWQAVRILAGDKSGASTPIMRQSRSLMKILSNYSIYILRVYVLLRPEEVDRLEAIKSTVGKSLSSPKG